jgi:hypothetical protein
MCVCMCVCVCECVCVCVFVCVNNFLFVDCLIRRFIYPFSDSSNVCLFI